LLEADPRTRYPDELSKKDWKLLWASPVVFVARVQEYRPASVRAEVAIECQVLGLFENEDEVRAEESILGIDEPRATERL
jgi:hypothetical protein